MPHLNLPQASIYYEIQASDPKGPWVTMINGHTRSSRDFKLLSKSLADAGFSCLTFDNRGSGLSTYQGPLQWADLVNDARKLWEELEIQKTHLMGISLGGMISQVLAAEHPQHIDRLALVSTAAHVDQLRSFDFLPWGNTLDSVRSRLAQYLTPAFTSKNGLLLNAMAKQTLTAVLETDFVAQAEAQHAAIKNVDNRPLLKRIEAKTLILHGSEDAVIGVEAAEELNGGIQDSELHIVEGAGHLLLAEYSKGLAQELLDWFKV